MACEGILNQLAFGLRRNPRLFQSSDTAKSAIHEPDFVPSNASLAPCFL
jgi:hypothetical protein